MDHPIRLTVDDDLHRTRLTVFFRLFLVIPHIIVALFWAIAVYFVHLVNFWWTLFAGQSPPWAHDFQAGFVRYYTQILAYQNFLADPWPSIGGGAGYPVDLEIAQPERQNRWTVFFRFLLFLPALILSYALGYLLNFLGFVGWFICLFSGRMPEGLRNVGTFCLSYQAQAWSYFLLLTPRYPSLSTGEPVTPPMTTGT